MAPKAFTLSFKAFYDLPFLSFLITHHSFTLNFAPNAPSYLCPWNHLGLSTPILSLYTSAIPSPETSHSLHPIHLMKSWLNFNLNSRNTPSKKPFLTSTDWVKCSFFEHTSGTQNILFWDHLFIHLLLLTHCQLLEGRDLVFHILFFSISSQQSSWPVVSISKYSWDIWVDRCKWGEFMGDGSLNG